MEWYDSGIGFAVPLADMLPVLDRLAAGETLRPGKLGVTFKGAALDAEPVIDTVRPQSPAEAAGLRPGDRLVEVAGRSVTRPDLARLALGPLRAGDEAALVAERDGRRVELTATLAADLPPWNPADLGVLPGERPEASADEPGVPIAHVFPGSAADGVLSTGDVITSADGEPTATAADLRRVVSRRTPGTEMTFGRAAGEPATVTLGSPPTSPPAELPDLTDPAADPLPEDRSGRLDLEVPGFEGRGGQVLVPKRVGRNGFGMIVFLPPAGVFSYERFFAAFEPAAEREGVVLLIALPELPIGLTARDLPFVAAAVEQTAERYGVDPARVAAMGVGREGRSAWGLAGAATETYRGVVTDAAPERLPENGPEAPLVPLILGEPDAAAAERLSAAGLYPATLPGATAGEVPAGEAADAVVRWAASLDRI